MNSLSHQRSAWWGLVAILVFLVHASLYLYFFVDDEGITLMYARSLLEGRGLTYAPSEGPTEGYSNFLHVLVMAGVLAMVELAGLDAMWAFVAGGLWSLACGAVIVFLVWQLGARLEMSRMARTSAALVLALSGPLAVWSNSSLETVPFALTFLMLIALTLPDIKPLAATVAAIAGMLLRIDGALFVVVWIVARSMFATAAERRTLLMKVAPGILAAGTLYVLVRSWYFGAWLSLPLQTKVAHKLAGAAATVVWSERDTYLLEFASRSGWPILLGLLALAAVALQANGRRRFVWALGLTVVALLAYVGTVGDWMFGHRFVVPLLAPLALLFGFGLALVEKHRSSVARFLAAGSIALAVLAAVRFQAFYQVHQQKPSFWSAPSLDPAKRFGEYYEAFVALKALVSPGMRIAYHEAGFVPFLLGVENIDMLGLTSKVVGGMPTLDAIYTDVGRYYPLTPEPPHHAVHAYLVYLDPALIVVRNNWMRFANGGGIPGEILDGHYAVGTETKNFVIYRRTDRPSDPRRRQASGFLENVAHPAYLDRVAVNHERIHPDAAAAPLPSLWQGGSHPIIVAPRWTLHLAPRVTVPVYELYLEGSPPSGDLRVEMRVTTREGTSRPIDQTAPAGKPLRIQYAFETPQAAEAIDLHLTSVTGQPVRLRLNAVRVMGQSEGLREHVLRHIGR